ncbi:2-keto-4-pentenoate hydratase [Aspergillus affinis]|uniref:2-keto-4-pentenoate hydratase n=1 Tax=Aspergillus affinis TaxID=1070780 RepID=UPI0022FF0FEE|nr:TodF product hydratase [Aspergillus affinis]KAI9034870.1 TodF product hydratase [Aspergillus affinis]
MFFMPSTAEQSEIGSVGDGRHCTREPDPIQAPTKTWPALDADSTFEVQRIGADEALKKGDHLVGYKLGNIAKVMQNAFGLDHPDYGFLLASTTIYEGTSVPRNKYIKPFVELEPAFVLRAPLRGPNATIVDVMNANDYAIPAIEIINSRVQNWAIDLPDTLADNGPTGSIILGGTPRKLTELTLRDTRGILHFNGREVMTGNTANVLGNPLSAVAWLVSRLAAYDIEFQPGRVILPGSCLEAVPMEETGHWKCTFEGWGTIEFDVV